MNLGKITKTYYLPKKLRPVLKKVWGISVFGENHTVFKKCQKIIKQKGFKKIITVGDYCSLSLPSDVKIFDNRIQRKVVENNLPYSLEFINPAGTIQKQAWKIIDQAIKQERNIFVKGEEDLLVIPVVLLSPKNTVIIYGLPGKGVCLIESSAKIKKELKELLKKFDTK